MRLILTILLFIPFVVNATNYYVSNSGSNAANGLTQGTAWQTISKVNSSSFSAGDSILFKCGDSWNEQLIVPSSGAYGNHIIFSKYGTGANPIITGFQAATGWTDSTGNIWMASIPNSVAYQNTILVNGRITAKGRYPNYTFLGGYAQAIDRVTLQTTIPFNCTGAELVFSNYVFIWDINKVASQSGNSAGDTLRLQTALSYNTNWVITPRLFIQNKVECLDTLNEWHFDSVRKKLFLYSSGAPTDVKYSVYDTLVSTHNRSYVTFEYFSFQGGNRITFSADSGSYVTIKNCSINYSGKNGVQLNKSPKTTIQYTTINNSLNDGIYMRWPSDSTLMDTDTIKNTGLFAGMGMSGNAANEAVFSYGNVIKFTNNRLDSSGYNSYTWLSGLKDTVYKNYITNYCLIKADGGGIYTDGSAGAQTGSLVRSNIVGNGLGAFGFGVAGIYLDNSSSGILVDSNTTFHNTIDASIFFNGGTSITCRNNTSINDIGGCFRFANGAAFAGTIKNNIFYSTTRTYPVNYFGASVPNAFIFEDSNYVLRGNAIDSLFQYGQSGAYYGLAAWQSFSSQDAHTIVSFPSSIVSTTGTLYYNTSSSDSTFTLPGRYIDVAGNTYTNSITIHPYQSALLFYASAQLPIRYGNLIFSR